MTYRIGGATGLTILLGGFALVGAPVGTVVIWWAADDWSLTARILYTVFLALLAGLSLNLMLYVRRYVISLDASGFSQRDHMGLHRAAWSDVAASRGTEGRLRLLDSRGKVLGTFDLDVDNRDAALQELTQHLQPMAPAPPYTASRKGSWPTQVGIAGLAIGGSAFAVAVIMGGWHLLPTLAVSPVACWAVLAFSAYGRVEWVTVTRKALELREGKDTISIPWSAVTTLELKFYRTKESSTKLQLMLEENGTPRDILPDRADPLFLYLAARQARQAATA